MLLSASECCWLLLMADLGLCHPDSNQDDASGALAAFSRVVGGVQFTITTQAWQDAQSAYEAREPYYDWAWGGRPAEVTTTKLLRPRANWSEGWLAGQMLVFEEDLQVRLQIPSDALLLSLRMPFCFPFGCPSAFPLDALLLSLWMPFWFPADAVLIPWLRMPFSIPLDALLIPALLSPSEMTDGF